MSFKNAVSLARKHMCGVIDKTPLQLNKRLSKLHNCTVYLKREDLTEVRSFKGRGAFNKIFGLSEEKRKNGIVCASAGNHAQGVAYTCNILKISGDIFVPECTPKQKIERIKYFGGTYCTVHIVGTSFSDALELALKFGSENNKEFVHPYNDMEVIVGQATIADEIFEELVPDIIICAIGGGGLISGISLYSQSINPEISVIGSEPDTAPSMKLSLEANQPVDCDVRDNFVDGATVKRVGDLTFDICRQTVKEIYVVPVGRVCQEILELHQNDGIIVEPAGALSSACLSYIPPEKLVGKKVVCIISGGNNDVSRYQEITERYQRFKNKRHYYIIEFIQKAGELRKFVNSILGEEDDIIRFGYLKRTNKEYENVLIGLTIESEANILSFEKALEKNKFIFTKIKEDDLLYKYLL